MLGFLPLESFAQPQGFGDTSDVDISVIRFSLGAGILVAMMLAALLVFRKRSRGGPSQQKFLSGIFGETKPAVRVDVLETRRLSMNADVSLISSMGREFLIVTTSAGATVLCDCEVPHDGSFEVSDEAP